MRVVLLSLLLATKVFAAGGVVGEPGSCIIEIGLYTAHFTIYQPDSSGDEEYCDDLPAEGRTLFVLDYLHGSLKEVPLDFRIIRDQDDLGIFARWENIVAIDDIDARTVFYQAPVIRPENQFSIEHNFDAAGGYIGIVTAPHPSKDIVYHAVFPFQVARRALWIWLLPLLLATAGWYGWNRRRRA